MLKIRLQRTGRKHEPTFRLIVTPQESGPKTGKYIEKLGFYEAKLGRKEFDTERIKYWIGKGAKVSDTVHNFLVGAKVIEGKKINVLPRHKKTVKGESVQEIVKREKGEEKPQEETPAEEAEVILDSTGPSEQQ